MNENLFEKVQEISKDVKELRSSRNDHQRGELNQDDNYYIDFIKTANIEMVWQGGSQNEFKRNIKRYCLHSLFAFACILLISVAASFINVWGWVACGAVLLAFCFEIFRLKKLFQTTRAVNYTQFKKSCFVKVEEDDYGLPENIRFKKDWWNIVLIIACFGFHYAIVIGELVKSSDLLIFIILLVDAAILPAILVSRRGYFLTNYRAVFVKGDERYGSWELYNIIRKYKINVDGK